MKNRRHIAPATAASIGLVVLSAGLFFAAPRLASISYTTGAGDAPATDNGDTKQRVAHLQTPESVKALYMTSWVAGTSGWREDIAQLIDETEINAVVIDIKDYTGHISFAVEDPYLKAIGSTEERIPDVREFVADLHRRGIYVIGRISVFQDPYLTKKHPEWAVRRASDGAVWADFKGLTFTDPGAVGVWEYHVAIAKEAWQLGFDELNFDYIRFPSDGNMKDIAYPFSGNRPKADVLEDFFAYLHKELHDKKLATDSGQTPKISADLFGYTTTNTDDLGIGQIIERTFPYFDYVMPMVYPSHYNAGFIGIAKPATKPYEVVKYSMDSAIRRAQKIELAKHSTATTTEVAALRAIAAKGHGNVRAAQLRPWLQDFDLGATYTADMVRSQIQATYDAGLTSWALWDAGNTYTKSALQPE